MTNMTLAVPEDLHKIMRKHNEVRWSEVARKALWNHARRLEKLDEMDQFFADSTLTEEDTIRIGKEINKKVAERLRARSSSTPTGSSPLSSKTARQESSS